MAGEAKTSEFLLSTATVMVGPMSKVMELSPALHSIGLVKNVQVKTTPKFVDLTQGVNAQVVFSVNTELQSKITSEVFEYTGANLAYAAGLDGSAVTSPAQTSCSLATAVSVGGASLILATGSVALLALVTGSYVVVSDGADKCHVGKVASITSDTLTLATGYTMPTSAVYPISTSIVYAVNRTLVGATNNQALFAAKLVGILPGSGSPITMIFPKIRITAGMDLAFDANNNFSNMPFEFQPYAMLPSDPYYADFGGMKPWAVLRT